MHRRPDVDHTPDTLRDAWPLRGGGPTYVFLRVQYDSMLHCGICVRCSVASYVLYCA